MRGIQYRPVSSIIPFSGMRFSRSLRRVPRHLWYRALVSDPTGTGTSSVRPSSLPGLNVMRGNPPVPLFSVTGPTGSGGSSSSGASIIPRHVSTIVVLYRV